MEAGHGSGLSLESWWELGGRQNRRHMTFLQESWREIGLDVRVIEMDPKDFRARTAEKRSPIFLTGWFGDFPDPDTFLYTLFHTRNRHVLMTNYTNPDFDALTEQGRTSSNPLEREDIYKKAASMLLRDAPVVFLYHQRGYVVTQPRLQGVRPHFTPPIVRPRDVWISEELS